MCKQCISKRGTDNVHPYFYRLYELYVLKKAGYPFSANELDYAVWMDLAELESEIEKLKWENKK